MKNKNMEETKICKLPWMEKIRQRLKEADSPEIRDFIKPIFVYGMEEERRITNEFDKIFKENNKMMKKKKWRCIYCFRTDETEGDIVMNICPACIEQMEEVK